jgi:hypothetical protein
MNKICLKSGAALAGALLMSLSAHATGGEVLSVRQVSATLVQVTFKTADYCNNPSVSLKLNNSGRAAFGPYDYELNVMPVFRMGCGNPEVMTADLSLDQTHSDGDLIIISGDRHSHAELTFVGE